MADRMRLTDGSDTVDFSPLLSYTQPDNTMRAAFVASDATKQWCDWGSKQKHVVPINNISQSDADQLNTWWDNLTMLTCTPDLTGAPGTTIYVKMGNEQQPMQMWFDTDWEQKYEGTLILNEVSSSSSGS